MITSLILRILAGLIRHAITTAGGAFLANGLQIVDGIPVIHDLKSVITGGVMALTGAAMSAAQKVRTKSGADYSGLNQ